MAKKIMFSDKFGLTEAVLSGRKTQTRRIAYEFGYRVDKCKIWGNNITYMDGKMQVLDEFPNPRYKVGEVVAIAQCYRDVAQGGYPVDARYDAFRTANWGDGEDGALKSSAGWSNKLFVKSDLMPHHIRITNVRVERLQGISDEDCIREGISPYYYGEEAEKIECGFAPDGFSFDGIDCHYPTPREAYAAMIDKISGKGTWDSNPLVFVYDFELVD